jgi:hypothetical protein
VRRILVIQDVGLWIDLNRHLSGVDSVDLVEAMSFEQAQILAQVERPEIVVYREGSGPEPEELLQQLQERGVREAIVLAVARTPEAGSLGALPAAGEAAVCAQEELVDLVGRLLDLETAPEKPQIELLAHYDVEPGSFDEPRSGFAVVLELSERRLLLEADLSLEPGTNLLLNFFLQEPDGDAQRTNVSLACVVSQCHDEAKQIYSARVTKLAEPARRAIQLYTANSVEGASR